MSLALLHVPDIAVHSFVKLTLKIQHQQQVNCLENCSASSELTDAFYNVATVQNNVAITQLAYVLIVSRRRPTTLTRQQAI